MPTKRVIVETIQSKKAACQHIFTQASARVRSKSESIRIYYFGSDRESRLCSVFKRFVVV